MDRRRFLVIGSTGFASIALSPLVRCAPRAVPVPAPVPLPSADLAVATTRARALGKPLLVIVEPEDRSVGWKRSEVVGEILNQGSDAVMADLALCEVVCASVAAIRAAHPDLPDPNDRWLLLVEADSPPRSLELSPPVFRFVRGSTTPDDAERRFREDEERLPARVVAWVHDNVAADAPAVAARARAAEATLDEPERRAIEAAAREPNRADLAIVDRGAALLLDRAAGMGTEREARAALAAAAKLRLRSAAPPGSRWAKRSFCGIQVEGDTSPGSPCGMGFPGRDGERFLDFYSRGSR